MDFDESEYRRWMEQAEYTPKAAGNDHKGGFFSWSCFKSQQAAEYALKGLLLGIGELATGHSLLKLCENLEEAGITCDDVADLARKLDKFYIPTRYPDAYPEGSPSAYYAKDDSEAANRYAKKIIRFCGGRPMTLERAKARRRSMRAGFIGIAKAYAREITKKVGKATIVLYGSVARGDFNRASDIDVLVVSDNLPKDFMKRFDILLEKAHGGLEPKGYTTAEFFALARKKNFKAMLEKRIVLADGLGLF